MLAPRAGHLFRIALFALFLSLLGARISFDLLDSGRKTTRAKEAMDATPEPKAMGNQQLKVSTESGESAKDESA